MRRNGYQGHALIEALHSVQEAFGYLEPEGLRYVAQSLRVPLSQAYGAATFYHFFTMKPPGRRTCVVCTGTACYINGAPALLAAMEAKYGIKPGETTPDGVFEKDVVGRLTAAEMVAKAERFVGHDV